MPSHICRPLILVVAAALACSCAPAEQRRAARAVKLIEPIVIQVVKGQGVKIAKTPFGAGLALVTVVGVFIAGKWADSVLEEEGVSYVVIDHLVGDETKTSVVRIEDSSDHLKVRVKGDAEIDVAWNERRAYIDALTEDTTIIVSDPASGGSIFSEGEILADFGGAFDLESGRGVEVLDPTRPPKEADLFFDGTKASGGQPTPQLINGASAHPRGERPTDAETCARVGADEWTDVLSGDDQLGELQRWCVRASNGTLGVIEYKRTGLIAHGFRYDMWRKP